jgi:hypothetical protein
MDEQSAMDRAVYWLPDSPLRRPNWRWLRAQHLLTNRGERTRRPWDDARVLRAKRFLAKTSGSAQSPTNVRARDKAIAAALELWRESILGPFGAATPISAASTFLKSSSPPPWTDHCQSSFALPDSKSQLIAPFKHMLGTAPPTSVGVGVEEVTVFKGDIRFHRHAVRALVLPNVLGLVQSIAVVLRHVNTGDVQPWSAEQLTVRRKLRRRLQTFGS